MLISWINRIKINFVGNKTCTRKLFSYSINHINQLLLKIVRNTSSCFPNNKMLICFDQRQFSHEHHDICTSAGNIEIRERARVHHTSSSWGWSVLEICRFIQYFSKKNTVVICFYCTLVRDVGNCNKNLQKIRE